jgi:PIN like domain
VDHFPEDAPDEVWITRASAEGWVVITRDKGIRYRDTELEALKAGGVAAFVLTAKGLTGPQNGEIIARALPRMTRFLTGNRPPFIAAVSASSRLTMLYRGHKPRTRSSKRRR